MEYAIFTDYDCSLDNPAVLATLILSAGPAAPFLVGVWLRVSGTLRRRLLLGAGLALASLFAAGAVFWLIWHVRSPGESVGCIGDSPFWQKVLVQLGASAVFGALTVYLRGPGRRMSLLGR